jgi:hypothetical protein
MSTKFLSPGWRMPRNANQSKQSNYSMDFDGSISVINLGNTDAVKLGAGDFTFSAWINPNSWGSGYEGFYSNNSTNGVFIGKDNAGNFILRITNVSNVISYSTLPTVNAWTHICITRLNGTCTLYYNGSSVATGSSTQNFNANTNVYIGGDPGTGPSTSALMNGQITEVSIFDYALSASQVTTLWGGGTSVSNPMALPRTPIAYYPLGTSAWNGDYLAENNAIGDYVFDITTTSQRFLTPLNAAEKTNLTYSVWFKTSSGINSNKILFSSGRYGTFQASMYTNQIIVTAQVYTGSLTGSSTSATINFSYGDNKWHHYVLNFDGSHMKFYIDGVLKAKNAKSGVLNYHPNSLRDTGIGNTSYVSSNAGLVGEYSNFISHNATLTDGNVSVGDTATGEIATLYNYGSPIQDLSNIPQSSNIESWYKLDASATYNSSTTTWTIPDDSTNSNDGTSSGMSQSNLVQSDLQTVAPYSKYALSFDGTNDYIDCGDSDSFSFGNGTTDSSFSISAWVNMIDATNFITIAKDANSGREYVIRTLSDDKLYFYLLDNINGGYIGRISSGTVTSNQGTWIHTLYTYNGNSTSSGIKIYLNGSQVDNANYEGGSYTAMSNTSTNLNVGRQERGLHYGSGSISNVSIFDSALTSSQVREIYNEGLPSDLNTFSGAAPVAWWQLGSNSSWNGNRWIVADEIGSNNGYSQNMSPYMPESGLTNGVGTTANGVSSGMSEGSLVGDAPYSTANALSRGMAVTAKGTDVPPTLFNNTYSLNFDGTNETLRFIDANGSYTFNEFAGSNGTQSYSFWIKPDIDGSLDWIISGNHVAYGGFLFDNGQLRYYARYQGDFYFDLTLTNNVWQHVAVVFDSNGLVQPYKNGQPTTALTNIPMPYKSYYDRIGMLENRYHPIKGNLDEFSIYNYALSANQVKSIYNGVFGTPSNVLNLNPILYYRFEEGTGTTINDSSTAGSNAVKSNGVTFQTEAP